MAEAVRPPRRAKAKASRTKSKEKKKCETLRREEPDEVSLLESSREQEIPPLACELRGDPLKVLTDSQLQNDASEPNESGMFDIQLTSLTLSSAGSLPCTAETLKQKAEERASAEQEEVKQAADPGDIVATIVENPENFPEVEEKKLEQCGPSESTQQSNFSPPQLEVGSLQSRDIPHRTEDRQAQSVSLQVPHTVGMQCSCEATDIFKPPKVKKLYPPLPVEMTVEEPALVAMKPLFHSQRLYPELPSEPELAPFTKEQLKVFEPGSWLENVESYLEEFDSMAHQDRHKFYELLLNYSRCRKQLLLAEAELLTLTADCQNARSRLWHFKEEQVSAQGICADQVKVSGYHRYQRVEMNENALGDLKKLFDAKSEHLHQTLALHSYTSVLSRLQVESYLYALLKNLAVLSSATNQQGPASKQIETIPSDLCQLKECISVLFTFTRRVNQDTQFHDDILLWLQKLVAVLQRFGCTGDHIFLLNHILRCPAGVSNWAVPFIQIKVLNNPSGIFHFMQSLALLMSPVKNRAEFMCHMKPSERNLSSSGPDSGNWTLVDEGGEEDEDPETSWILLNEDDLVTLLSQFPFHELFQHLLGIKAKGDYLPETTRPQEMMKIFAFANSLVELLGVGLETFNRARYRQFVKRIGYMIRMTLGYVSDHWAQFVSHNQGLGLALQPYSIEKLQVEFDELFLRAVLRVLKAKRLGIWLFMSEMPFGTVSVHMLWKLLYLMHQVESGDLEKLGTSLQTAQCKRQLQDPQHFLNVEKCLSSMNSSEEICLLTTFAQMAQARRTNVDEDFIKIIVLEIYEVSYVILSTRETFSKVGRELLGAITAVHPEIISILLERVQETIDQVGMVSLYLFKELPLHLWRPSASEIAVIRDWLLNHDLTSVKNKLACVILEGLNWGFGEQDVLHLNQTVHAEVALMVLEAYQKYLAQKPYAGLLSESMKQVSYLASIVRYGETPETSFNQWAWNLILRLKLHKNDYGIQQNCPTVPFSSVVPDMTESPTFHPLLKAVKAGMPIGCYLALSMTAVGHSIEKFCAEGITLLGILVQSRHLRTVVHVLDKILPLFYPCQYYLLKNEQFLSHLLLFLHLDSGVPQGVTQQVTHKVAQHLTGANHGENVKLLNSMIQAHISVSIKPNEVGPVAVLEFWVQALISQHLWYREQTILFLMDHLCKTAFQLMQEDCVQKLLYQQHKNALGYHCDRGLLSSLVSWIVAGNITPSFVEGLATSTQVWFAWTVLNMESIFEEDSQLRRIVEGELVINSGFTPDQALKKAQAQLKLPIVPSLQRLLIYRWAHQALVTPSDHPLLPLIWQKFFLLYLHRPGPQYGLPIDGCIGRKFFQSPAHISLLKDMKRRLTEVADFHHAASKALRIPAEGSERPHETQPGAPAYLTSPELHTELVRLFNVYILWLEDETFQTGDAYIPSLPKHYDVHRLAKVMQNQQDLWLEYLNMERIHHEFQETAGLWTQARRESHSSASSSSAQLDFTDPLLAKERVLSNLQKYEAPHPPLVLHPVKPPVPVIPLVTLLNQNDATQLIRVDLDLLQQQARTAALRESQQVALDSELLDTMPKQYVNREEQTTLHLECRGSGGKKCQGAAVVTVQFEGMYKNEAVSQQIYALRKEVKLLQAEAAKPPSLHVVEAAVHAENLITALVNAYKLQPTPAIQKVGISLFFAVVDHVSDETQRHPPSRQFFTSCLEILGQVFISGTKSECKKVLLTILKNRRLCSLLSPFFTPNASPEEFIQLYEKVVRCLSEDNSDLIFMLLTKFDLKQWLNSTKPPLSDRTRLLESIHLALIAWGLEPDEDILMPFNLFCKHWTYLLLYQFPDQYSDILRLLMQSSAEQLLSPECWNVTLRALGCCPADCQQGAASAESAVLQSCPDGLLSDKQVMETIQWLSNFFYKLRLSNVDFKSFGLFSKWNPYMAHVKMLLGYLVKRLIDSEMACLAQDPSASSKTVLRCLHSVIVQLFKPWILVLEDSESKQGHYPWLESDTVVASSIVQLFTDCINLLHENFKDKLLPGDDGALRLHIMHYCEACTAPRMPEFILYAFHTAYQKLPWRDLHPDQVLMEAFFKVERGSPKSCFLFLGFILCEVNWVSVLSDAWNPSPLPETRSMMVCLLFMMILLGKEDQLVEQTDSPLLSLLGQTSSLSWHLVDSLSYQGVINYFSSHYPPSIILAKVSSAESIVKLLKVSAGLSIPTDSQKHLDAVAKGRAFIHQMVQFLNNLEQNGKISLAVLDQQMAKLLDDIIFFSPPDMDSQSRHMALSSLFVEVLMMMNNSTVPTAEFLRGSIRTWIGQKVSGLGVLPLLTAACHSLASVRHMAEITEACIMAYFKEDSLNKNLGWGAILVSLQVPELTIDEFLQECISLGSYLTLYVYLLQCLNSEQTLRNEMKVLLILSKWMEQVFPSCVQDEAKLFLWWHQVLQLSLIQMEQNDSILMESAIRILLMLQSRASLLAEERFSSGILGAIGFGRRSPLSNRFRVAARSMAAFLSVQVPAEDQVRLKPGSELHLTLKAQQALSALESLISNKQYVEYQDQIAQATRFIKHAGHCLHDGKAFLAILVNCLYPEVHYLDNIR
ncbi:PREDICTED: ectopic P granules protein 5 homolog [Elephantulus edwardii]|uniref:ectopic P granules protein 5 homolog n=1 Tax=Elephantulus edwardii TaxID=28737 RepID=UPI0003F0BDBE|nr:PREDICTED: ectopic P granules protein 5 homolog [Elephantulus edwardii]